MLFHQAVDDCRTALIHHGMKINQQLRLLTLLLLKNCALTKEIEIIFECQIIHGNVVQCCSSLLGTSEKEMTQGK